MYLIWPKLVTGNCSIIYHSYFQFTGVLDWALNAVATFTTQCQIKIQRNTTLWEEVDGIMKPPPDIDGLICPGLCSFRGTCVNGRPRSTEIHWNLYEATTTFCGLSRQVVFHDRENKHDFVKTVPGKLWNLCVFSRTFLVSLYRFHCSTCLCGWNKMVPNPQIRV